MDSGENNVFLLEYAFKGTQFQKELFSVQRGLYQRTRVFFHRNTPVRGKPNCGGCPFMKPAVLMEVFCCSKRDGFEIFFACIFQRTKGKRRNAYLRKNEHVCLIL